MTASGRSFSWPFEEVVGPEALVKSSPACPGGHVRDRGRSQLLAVPKAEQAAGPGLPPSLDTPFQPPASCQALRAWRGGTGVSRRSGVSAPAEGLLLFLTSAGLVMLGILVLLGVESPSQACVWLLGRGGVFPGIPSLLCLAHSGLEGKEPLSSQTPPA